VQHEALHQLLSLIEKADFRAFEELIMEVAMPMRARVEILKI